MAAQRRSSSGRRGASAKGLRSEELQLKEEKVAHSSIIHHPSTHPPTLHFIHSFIRLFTDSLVLWFVGYSLFHFDSLIHWFIDLFSSLSQLCMDSFMSFHCHLNSHLLVSACISQLQHFVASALLHVKNFPIGNLLPIVAGFFFETSALACGGHYLDLSGI